MSTAAIPMPRMPKEPKNRIHMHINTMDNGYTLSVDRTINDKYEIVELVFTSKPKLLKAIAQFLTIENEEE